MIFLNDLVIILKNCANLNSLKLNLELNSNILF